MKDEKGEEFDKLVRPLLKYLNENHSPYARIIIDNMTAELVEGVMVLSTDEYLVD